MANTKINELVHRAQLKGVLLVEDSKGNWRAEYNHGGELWTLDSAQPEDVLDDMDALIETLQQDDLYNADFNEDLNKYLVSVNGVEKPFVADTLREAFAMAKAHVLAKAKPQETARRRFGKRAEPEPVEEVVEEAEVAEQAPEPAPEPRRRSKPEGEPITEKLMEGLEKEKEKQRQREKLTSPPVGIQPPGQGRMERDALPPALTNALVDCIQAITNLLSLIAAQVPITTAAGNPIRKGNGEANVKTEEVEEFNEPTVETTSPLPRRRAAPKRA